MQPRLAAAPKSVLAQEAAPAFPKGAIIRTLFKDYAPEELAGGATLFHEHLSLGPDFSDRFRAASAAVLAAQGISPPARPPGPPPAPPGPDPQRGREPDDRKSCATRKPTASPASSMRASKAPARISNFIREAAKQSGLPVVKGAGFYTSLSIRKKSRR